MLKKAITRWRQKAAEACAREGYIKDLMWMMCWDRQRATKFFDRFGPQGVADINLAVMASPMTAEEVVDVLPRQGSLGLKKISQMRMKGFSVKEAEKRLDQIFEQHHGGRNILP